MGHAFALHRLFRFLLLLVFCLLPLTGIPQSRADIQVVDADGRRLTIAEPARRVVTTFKPATLFVLSLGGADLLVGLDTSSRRDPQVTAVAPELAALPGVGSKSRGVNLETLLGLDPDLVILYAHNDGIKLARRLTAAGVPALVIKPETFASIRETINILAVAMGRQERGEEVNLAMDKILDKVAARVSGLAGSEQKKVYYASPRGFLSTAPADMLQDEIIRKAGGLNAAAHLRGYFKNISLENLIDWHPQSIAVCRTIRPQAREMLARPVLSFLPAVQADQVHVFPSSLTPWDFPSPLSAPAVLWLSCRLYPELFADIDLGGEIDSFHRTLFGKSMRQMGGRLDDRLYDSAFPPRASRGAHGSTTSEEP